jgi:hypothetical protein
MSIKKFEEKKNNLYGEPEGNMKSISNYTDVNTTGTRG